MREILKKILSFVLMLSMAFISVSSALPVLAADLGDVDGDGTVDSADYILVKRHVLGTNVLSSSQQSRADVNQDGNVSAIDYVIIKRIALGTLESTVTKLSREAISYGKPYTATPSASSKYPDTNTSELTDADISSGTTYTNASFSGYAGNTDVVVNLGSKISNLSAFELSYLSVNQDGILPPTKLVVSGSANNRTWTTIGTVSIPKYTSDAVLSAVVEAASYVSYQYIKFSITAGDYWLFIDEVIVYADVEVKEDNSVDAYTSDTNTDTYRQQQLSSAASGTAYDPAKGETLVSSGKNYTISGSGYDSRAGANSSLLTDGDDLCASTDMANWVGINTSSASTITLTIATTAQKDINGFKLHCFNRKGSNICLPEYIDVLVSSNNKTYYNVGRIYAHETDDENYTYSLFLKTLVSARYVRFSIPAGSGYFWLEEIEVYANRYSGNLYGYFDFPTYESPEYWNGTDPDYDKTQNLLLGLSPQITTDKEISASSYGANNTSELSSILTDGKTTTSTNDSEWFRFYGGNGRSVFFDLGKISAISAFSVRFLYTSSSTYRLPASVKLIVSEDGKNWYVAGSVAPGASSGGYVLSSKNLAKEYRARYVMFYFPVASSAKIYIDEMTVTGKKNARSAANLSSELEKYDINTYNYGLPSDDLLGGAEDIVLVYHNGSVVDEDRLLPYVAYVDQDGNILDTMFDGFLFLPCDPMPAGGASGGTNTAADWLGLFDNLFASGRNLDALDSVAGKVKKALNKPDMKLQVYIAIPRLQIDDHVFGDIDGDGVNEAVSGTSTAALNNRIRVSKYYAQKVINRFKSENYENIELGAFYWHMEDVSARYETTVKGVCKAVKELGYQMLWIPYYHIQYTQYPEWESFGLTAASLQPNFAFDFSITADRIEEATNQMQQYGMSIEMEIAGSALTDHRYWLKYMEYLNGGIKYGYMKHSLHTYFQSIYHVFGESSKSQDPLVRLIYEYTYQFIKGSLDMSPDTVSEIKTATSKDTAVWGTLNPSKDPTTIYCVGISPEHGSISFTKDGEFVYFPNKGYTGTDTFTYRIGNYLGWSHECTVTINVG